MSQGIELFILAIGAPADDEWERTENEALALYRRRLESYPDGPINGSISLRNLGKGADWYVIAATVGGLFFVVPELHKRIRESLEEYRLIWNNLKGLFGWLARDKRALYPEQYLFLAALFHVSEENDAGCLIFLGGVPLPEPNPDLSELPPMLFAFLSGGIVIQVAVARDSSVLWSSRLQLPATLPSNVLKSKPLQDTD